MKDFLVTMKYSILNSFVEKTVMLPFVEQRLGRKLQLFEILALVDKSLVHLSLKLFMQIVSRQSKVGLCLLHVHLDIPTHSQLHFDFFTKDFLM